MKLRFFVIPIDSHERINMKLNQPTQYGLKEQSIKAQSKVLVTSALPSLMVILTLFISARSGRPAEVPAQPTTLAVASDAAAAPEPTVIERGPHHKLWQTVRQIQIGDKTLLRTNTYQELADGLCHLENDTWQDSQDLIELVDGGVGGAIAQTRSASGRLSAKHQYRRGFH